MMKIHIVDANGYLLLGILLGSRLSYAANGPSAALRALITRLMCWSSRRKSRFNCCTSGSTKYVSRLLPSGFWRKTTNINSFLSFLRNFEDT